MAKKKEIYPTRDEVRQFQMLNELIDSVYVEMKEFSKKKPEETLNKFKVKTVNRVLEQLKGFLQNEPTIGFLDLLDDETLPSNSDAILVIGQFTASMRRYMNEYSNGHGKWWTKEGPDGEYL